MFGFVDDHPEYWDLDGAAAPLLVRPLSRGRQRNIQYYGKVVASTLSLTGFLTAVGLAKGNSPGPEIWLLAFIILCYAGAFQLYHALEHFRGARIDSEAARETVRNFNLTARTFWIGFLTVVPTLHVALTENSSADNPSQLVQLFASIPACFSMMVLGCGVRIYREARMPEPAALPVALPAPAGAALHNFPHANEFYTLKHRDEAEALFGFIEASFQNSERLARLLTSEEYAQFFTENRFSLQLECSITNSLPEISAATIWEGNNPLGKPPYGRFSMQ
jgi:hypothetical protein